MKIYLSFLVLQVLVIAIVSSVFAVTGNRVLAGSITGGVFVVLGGAIFTAGLLRREFRRSACFVMGCLHLFIISIPMVAIRWIHRDLPFSEVRILGLPGPIFHNVATAVYFCMMVGTIFDVLRLRRIENKKGTV